MGSEDFDLMKDYESADDLPDGVDQPHKFPEGKTGGTTEVEKEDGTEPYEPGGNQ